MPAPLRVREIPSGESLEPFIQLSWTINARDPAWVPPLRMSVRSALDRAKHPFHRRADVRYLVAERGGAIVGRIAAVVNHAHNEFHRERTGFFGLFECVNDPEVAESLLRTAAEWLRGRGMDRMRGPMNLSTNEEISSPGILVEGFETVAKAMMSHNPPYYQALMEGAGMQKVKDLLAYHFDSPEIPPGPARVLERIVSREGAVIRPLEMRRFREELQVIQEIYNSAWEQNWGFVPMTDAEFAWVAKDFRPIIDPELCLIAEKDGEPIGFSLAIPDINQALRRIPSGKLFPFGIFRFLWEQRKIDSLRLITLGFKPQYRRSGLGAAFYLRTFQLGVRRGYDTAEASWILEDNHEMRSAVERFGARLYKRYRVYETPLRAEALAAAD